MRAEQETADNLETLNGARCCRSLAAAQLEARAKEGLPTDQVASPGIGEAISRK